MKCKKFLFGLLLLIQIIGCSKSIIPGDGTIRTIFYSDATGDKGNSSIWCIDSTSGVTFGYLLREGFQYPYAGISLTPDSGLMDLHSYSYMELLLSADTVCAVNIYIKTFEDSITVPDNYITYRFLQKTLWISEKPQRFRIDLASFTTPEWWLQIHKKITLGTPDFKRVNNFDIATESKYLNRKGSIRVHELKLKKEIHPYYWATLFALSVWGIIIIGLAFHIRKKKSKVQIISYKQVQPEAKGPTEEERVFSCIGKRYTETGLSINDVGTECGVHFSRVSTIIKNRYSLSFKQYLNKIKIEEAKRLLVETDRQIIDIALSVGYGDVSHFNRTFKQNEGCSPREFRKCKA